MSLTVRALVAFYCSIFGWFAHADETMPLPSAGKCLVDMCGTYESANFKNPIRPTAHIERIEADYSKLIRPFIEKEIQHEVWDKRETLKLIDFMPSVDVRSAVYSDDIKLMLNLVEVARLLSKLSDGEAIVPSTGPGGFKVKRDKARPIAAREKIADIEGTLNGVDAFISTGVLRMFQVGSYMKISTYHSTNFSTKSYADFLKYIFGYIETWDEKLQKINPFVNPQKSTILKKYASEGTVSDSESELFFSALASAHMVEKAYNSGELNSVLMQMKRDFPTEVNQRLQTLAGIQPSLIKALGQYELSKRASEVAGFCAGKYKNKMRSFPLREEVDSFKLRFVPQIVDAATKVLAKEGLERMSDKIRSLEWKPPLDYDAAVKSLVSSLEDDLETNLEFERSTKLFWDKLRSGDKATIALAVAKIINVNAEDLSDVLYSVNDDCKDVEPKGVVDSIFTDEKIVNVGWQTVLKPGTAAFTMGHEIGHLVYRTEKDSAPSVKRKVECLNQKHLGLEQDPSKFSEEDYADLFGFAVEKEHSPQRRNKNLFCYLRSSPTEKPSDQYSSLIQPEDDGHSSSLFRLISSAVEHNAVPNSCKSVQQEAKMTNGLEQCLSK